MKRYPEYSYFVSCCHRYKTSKRLLDDERYDPTSLIDTDIRRRLKQETETVERVFEKLNEGNSKLAKIMYLKLIDRKPLISIGLNSEVDMSKRQILMKYPENRWEAIYNDLLV